MKRREYSRRFAKSVSRRLVRAARRQELTEDIARFGSAAVYGALLMYAQTHTKRDGTLYDPGWAAHTFKEIYGAWPASQDRKAEPKALPNFLIDEWVLGRSKRKAQPKLPLFERQAK